MPLKPDSPGERSCFRGLRAALADHFSDDHIREGHEAEEALIRELLRTQPDAAVTQDLLAGFLNGYMLAVAEFGSEDLVSQHNDAMFSVIGGIYLVGGGAPLSCPPEHLDSMRSGFFRRLGRTLPDDLLPQPDDVERQYSAARDAIVRIFGTTPDVPVNIESLAGFVLGVMYSHRYVPADGEVLTAILPAKPYQPPAVTLPEKLRRGPGRRQGRSRRRPHRRAPHAAARPARPRDRHAAS